MAARNLRSCLLILAGVAASGAGYDPLAVSPVLREPLELTVRDGERQRELPILVYLPAKSPKPAPVVLFSHGLGGSRHGSAYLGRHWAARGYAAVFVQHPGSDEGVWKQQSPAGRKGALEQAANARNFLLRVNDIPAVLDQLERWNRESSHSLAGRLELSRVGMSGHSFGAVTTQAVSGQRAAAGGVSFTDARIKAATAFSPSSPRGGVDPARAFGGVGIPWMLMTGTRDLSVIGGADLESRLAVFPALPPGGKYEVVLFEAEHSAFTERPLPGDTARRNPNHHRVILALSTAFWDAMLRQDPVARQWLDGGGPASILEHQDRWQKK